MKTIKNKIYKFLALLPFCVFLSCCDVLEKEPQSILEIESFYSTGSEAEMGLVGIYNRFFAENHIVGTFMILDISSDDLTTPPPRFGYLMENREEMSSLNNDGTAANFNASWITIANVNLFIEKVSELPPTAFVGETTANANRKDEILGEAYFIRGVSYYYLAMLWRHVPLILEFPEGPLPQDNQVPNSTQEQVLAQAKADLVMAESLLPDVMVQFTPNERRGRASKAAANAYLSRFALMENNWQAVVDMSNEILSNSQYTLVDPWTRLFLNEQNSNEAILEIQAERSQQVVDGDEREGEKAPEHEGMRDAGQRPQQIRNAAPRLRSPCCWAAAGRCCSARRRAALWMAGLCAAPALPRAPSTCNRWPISSRSR